MEITLTEILELIHGLRSPSSPPEPEKDLGQNIVVLDRGFVYVGEVTEATDRIVIKNARNIRVWGTKQGLGELRNGPLPNTKLDPVGEVAVYRNAVMHLIPCKGF